MFKKKSLFILTLEELFQKRVKLFFVGFAGELLYNTFLQLQLKNEESFVILKEESRDLLNTN